MASKISYSIEQIDSIKLQQTTSASMQINFKYEIHGSSIRI